MQTARCLEDVQAYTNDTLPRVRNTCLEQKLKNQRAEVKALKSTVASLKRSASSNSDEAKEADDAGNSFGGRQEQKDKKQRNT